MEKLKLNDKQRYDLLDWAYRNIVSQGVHPYHFLSPKCCSSLKFNLGVFSKRTGARVEIVYSFDSFTVRLLLLYSRQNMFNDVFDFVFVPKAITIERDFRNSILISILKHPETSFCNPTYIYQSIKSIPQLCESDSVEGEDVADGCDSVCRAGESVDSPLPNENKHSVTSQQ